MRILTKITQKREFLNKKRPKNENFDRFFDRFFFRFDWPIEESRLDLTSNPTQPVSIFETKREMVECYEQGLSDFIRYP